MLAPYRSQPADGETVVLPVTLAEVKTHLRIDGTDFDSLVASYLSAAVAEFDGWSGVLGRCLVDQEWNAAYEGWPECGDLRLPFPNVSEVGLVFSDVNGVEQTVAATDYELLSDELGSFIRLDDEFQNPTLCDDRSDAVRATFTAGYGGAADVPGDIKAAIKIRVASLFDPNACDLDTVARIIGLLTSRYRRVGA